MTTADLTQVSLSLPAATDRVRPAGWVVPALSLCRRELVRFLRQRHRVIGALATPIVFWLLIGGGMQHSFNISGPAGAKNAVTASTGAGYMQYFFPGTILMILLFTAIFSTISIIEDRREGFLQAVLVAPVPRMAIVLGKVLGGTVLAFVQALVFLLLAPTVGIHLTFIGLIGSMLMMLLLAFSLTSLGFCIAWRMSSTQGFHAVMNLFLMPMWFLSGALFPMSGAVGPVKWMMRVDPLSYGLEALSRCLYLGNPSQQAAGDSFTFCLAISLMFAAGLFTLASAIANKRVSADLV